MNSTPPITCAIYARVSTDHGLKQEFNSIDAQIESCQHYIAINKMHGWQNDSSLIFTDEALSGGNTERPALQKMLKLIRAKKIQVVLIYKIDRLSRNLRDFIEMQELFTQHGCSLVSTTESFDTSTAMGRAMLNLVGVFAQLERERTRERITDKIAASKARGLWVGGVPPYGYLVKDSKLVIDKARAALVQQIYEKRVNGIFPQAIAAELRAQNIPYSSKRHGDTKWTAKHVGAILKCPTYAGYVIHKENRYEGVHTPIIEREQWQLVQSLMERGKAEFKYKNNDSPLRGLITCGQCGKKMMGTYTVCRGVRHRYYVCFNRHKNGKIVCDCPILPAGEAEKHLIGELIELSEDKELEAILHSIIPEYCHSLISDCLHNIDILLSRLNHEQLRELFQATYKKIEFSPAEQAFLLTKNTED